MWEVNLKFILFYDFPKPVLNSLGTEFGFFYVIQIFKAFLFSI